MKKILILVMFLITFISALAVEKDFQDTNGLYEEFGLKEKMSYSTFENAMKGYNTIKSNKNKDFFTIIDYTKPSTEKRFFVLDMKHKKIVVETLVAHGKNTGAMQALNFSDEPNSFQTSLGFFVTENRYDGEFGNSVRLNGLEAGINSRARERAIVIHGLPEVSENFINAYGFLGRSLGCPAVPEEEINKVVNIIKDGTLVFAMGNDPNYMAKSTILQQLVDMK